MVTKNPNPLIPVDLKVERCPEKATWVATENKPGADGRLGAMSMCDTHKSRYEEKMGKEASTFSRIEPTEVATKGDACGFEPNRYEWSPGKSPYLPPECVDRFQTLFKKSEMKQKDFAVKAGINSSAVSGLLGGRRKMTWHVLEGIRSSLGDDVAHWVLTGEGPIPVVRRESAGVELMIGSLLTVVLAPEWPDAAPGSAAPSCQ